MSGGIILVQTVARIWDLIFYEGRVSLFCVSIGILREVEKMILKFDRMDKLYEFLKNIHRVKLNIDKIVRVKASSFFCSASLFMNHNLLGWCQNVNIPLMSELVKRLSFSIVQTPAFDDTLSTVPLGGRKPNTYTWFDLHLQTVLLFCL